MIEPEIPGALRNMLEQNALFALMAVLVAASTWAFWKILQKYLSKLEQEAEQTKVLEEIRREAKETKDELKAIKDELLRRG